jgi:hypothetical protein
MSSIEMYLNKKNNRYARITVTIFTLAIIAVAASSMATAPVVEATVTTTEEPTTTTTTPPPEGIDLSPQPVYQERNIPTQTPINQTHIQLTYTGNGVLTLPNTTETINTTSNGSVIISTITQFGQGTETTRTEDGNETATATFSVITRLNPDTGEGKGIVIATFHTNSTGMLAPLNGMILSGLADLQPTEDIVTLWEWESGIPLSPTATTASEEPALTETMTTDDATGDTNNATEGATATIDEGEEEQLEQEQETTPLQ